MGHGVKVFVGGAEALQDTAQRIGAATIRLSPTCSELHAGYRIVTAADIDPIAALVPLLVLFSGVAAAVSTLSSGHGGQL